MIYLNLSNGVEALPRVGPDARFCRIRSTTIERADWPGLILECDADMLLRLALGECCCVIDYGTRRVMSKTVSVGVPVVRDVLGAAWLGRDPETAEGRAAVAAILGRPETDAARQAKERVRYFARLRTCGEVRLIGASMPTQHDGDRAFQAGRLAEWMRTREGGPGTDAGAAG